MSDGMRRELVYLSSHATNRYFIPNWGSILEKTAQGSLDVYDAKMNPVKNCVLPAKQFDKAMKQLNRFFK